MNLIVVTESIYGEAAPRTTWVNAAAILKFYSDGTYTFVHLSDGPSLRLLESAESLAERLCAASHDGVLDGLAGVPA